MSTVNRSVWFNLASVWVTVFLLIFLPVADKFRSPGGVEEGWYECVFAAIGLLLLDVVGLKALWRAKWTNRLWLYVSIGVAVGVLFLLLHLWQEAKQFDYAAHGGKGYYKDHPPRWRP